MLVRAFNRKENHYFVSNVYAIINSGYYTKYLVLEEKDSTAFLTLVEYLDKESEPPIFPVNINVINHDYAEETWVTKSEDELLSLNEEFDINDKNNSIYSFRGYEFIYEQKDMLISLLKGKQISYTDSGLSDINICTKKSDWNYIESEEDIEKIMSEFNGFHDSVLKTMNYISGSEKTKNGMIVTDFIRQVSMTFDSDWSESIEIVFEGVLSLNLRPSKDNFGSDIFSASILLKDTSVQFYDDEILSERLDYEGTWVHALAMRWKFI